MKIRTLELTDIPGLETARGIYGSATEFGASFQEPVISATAYVFQVVPAELLG